MQSLWRMVYPPQCVSCGEMVEEDFALCGPCRRDCWFISGLVCDACGAPLPGEEACSDGVLCDDCLTTARPWDKGRSVFLYRDTGRKLVLSLKHGDRTDLAVPAGRWMAKAAAELTVPDMLVVPVPLHRWRFFKRRYNQSALLAQSVARQLGLSYCPDALIRPRRTQPQDGKGLNERFENLSGRILPHPRRQKHLNNRKVLLVDDVITSGATLAAASEACFAAGASQICVLTLARVVKHT